MFFFQSGKAVLQNYQLLFIGILMTLVFLGHYLMREQTLMGVIKKMPTWMVGIFLGFLLFGIAIVQSSGQQFIYFQF